MSNYDLIVIGGGSGGVRAARIAAGHGANVAVVENHRFGGTCVIRGCVPKKLFVYASEYSKHIDDAAGYGWQVADRTFDWSILRDHKDREIDRLEGIYEELLGKANVELVRGTARFESATTVVVDKRRLSARTILVATGGWPWCPEVPGIELMMTSNEVFELDALPRRLVVVGGGFIGLEFAHVFAGLGSEVVLVHRRPLVLRGFDHDIRVAATEALESHGIESHLDTQISHIAQDGDDYVVTLSDGATVRGSHVLGALGRRPNTDGLGLEDIGVELDAQGGIVVDERGQSSVRGIYAVGDVTNRITLTPIAIREGQAFADRVFGKSDVILDYDNIPTAVFCQPPAATVGLTEEQARKRCSDVEIYRTTFRPMKNVLPKRDQRTMMKLVVDKPTGRVVGVHMVGDDAPEMIQCLAIAVKMGATKRDFDQTVALHPTSAEEFVLMRNPV